MSQPAAPLDLDLRRQVKKKGYNAKNEGNEEIHWFQLQVLCKFEFFGGTDALKGSLIYVFAKHRTIHKTRQSTHSQRR